MLPNFEFCKYLYLKAMFYKNNYNFKFDKMSMSAQKFKSKNGGTGRRSSEARRPARGIAPRWWVLLVFLALLGLVCEPVLAAGEAEEGEDLEPANRLPEGVASPGAGA